MEQRELLKGTIEAYLPADLESKVNLGAKLDTILDIVDTQVAAADKTDLAQGLIKNLNDNPMFLSWLARTVARLSEKPLEKLMTNLILGTVLGRKTAEEKAKRECGHTGPITIVINPTMRCNLQCTGCYAANYAKNRDMPYSTLAKVLKEAREMGVRWITVTGGEPLLYGDLFTMATEFPDLNFLMFTNGTLIRETVAEQIAEVANLLPSISVEGFRPETDARRGAGVHDAVCRAMDDLCRHGVFFGISATPTAANTALLCSDDFIDSYIDRGALFAWLFNYIPIGSRPDLSLMPNPGQRDALRQSTLRWQRTKPIFVGDFWNSGPCSGGCLSASRYCFITPEGYVQPCVFVHFYTHKVPEHSLREAFESPFFQLIRDRQPYHTNLLRPCKIIDHPEEFREIISEANPHPCYPGADLIISGEEYVRFLDSYSEHYAQFADPAWEGPDYRSGRAVLIPFLGRTNVEDLFRDRMVNARRAMRRKQQRSNPETPEEEAGS